MSVLRGTADTIFHGIDIPSLNNVAGATLCAWVRLNSLPPVGVDPTDKYAPISISKGPPSAFPTNDSRIEMEIENDPGPLPKINVVARTLDADGGNSLSSASGEIIAGTVYHIAVVADYTNMVLMIFKNGVELIRQVMSGMTAGNTSATNSASGAIGSEDSGSPEQLDGYLEDERIYSRVLTPEEIQTIYECQGIDGIVRGLEQRYELQDNASNVLLSNSTPDNSGSQPGFNAFVTAGTPRYAESIAPTFRRRLP